VDALTNDICPLHNRHGITLTPSRGGGTILAALLRFITSSTKTGQLISLDANLRHHRTKDSASRGWKELKENSEVSSLVAISAMPSNHVRIQPTEIS